MDWFVIGRVVDYSYAYFVLGWDVRYWVEGSGGWGELLRSLPFLWRTLCLLEILFIYRNTETQGVS